MEALKLLRCGKGAPNPRARWHPIGKSPDPGNRVELLRRLVERGRYPEAFMLELAIDELVAELVAAGALVAPRGFGRPAPARPRNRV
ncbi:MAG: hypothetical protein HRF50_00475 [Phycisphaerae bacterium]